MSAASPCSPFSPGCDPEPAIHPRQEIKMTRNATAALLVVSAAILVALLVLTIQGVLGAPIAVILAVPALLLARFALRSRSGGSP
jgi:hypothetical protein